MPTCSTSQRMRTIRNGPKSRLCRLCWKKTDRGETMSRMPSIVLRVVAAALILFFGVCRMQAQAPATPPPAQTPAPPQEPAEEEENPFAPEPTPTLPPGMTGSDANDPRAKLTPGLYDAGEASMGIKHLQLLKKPDAFQLGSVEPDD